MTRYARVARLGRVARSAALACAATLCAACPQRTAVWVVAETRVPSPTLRISDVRGGTRPVDLGGIRVDRCDHEPVGDGAMWLVGPRGGTGVVRELAYGATLPGWEATRGPHPLAPGCYQVTLSGTGRTVFDVRPDGAVVERHE